MTSSPIFFSTGIDFAGDHRLVNGAGSITHLAIDRNLITRTHDDRVADDNLFNRQVDLLAVAEDPGCLGLKSDEFLDRLRRTALCLQLESKAKRDEGNYHIGNVPEHLRERHTWEEIGKRDGDDRIEKRGGDTDC